MISIHEFQYIFQIMIFNHEITNYIYYSICINGIQKTSYNRFFNFVRKISIVGEYVAINTTLYSYNIQYTVYNLSLS